MSYMSLIFQVNTSKTPQPKRSMALTTPFASTPSSKDSTRKHSRTGSVDHMVEGQVVPVGDSSSRLSDIKSTTDPSDNLVLSPGAASGSGPKQGLPGTTFLVFPGCPSQSEGALDQCRPKKPDTLRFGGK